MEVPLTKPVNRSLVVIAALLIQLCLGAIYSWSVFTPPLKEAPFLFSNTQTQAIFSISLLTFAIVMVLAGRWQAKSGPRIVSLLGGIVLGAGYILAGLFGHTFVSQILFIGLIGGAGIGLAYVCPISVGMKWFPDKKGLITGVAVAGFGFGALIWVKLAGSWGGLLESMGVLKVFLLYGIIFAAAVTVGSIWMVNPPAGWKPAGWEPPAPAEGADSKVGLEGLLPGAMLRQKGFYSLWVMFIFSSMAGLMIIGNIKLFGIEALRTSAAAMSEEQASIIAGTAMAVFYSIANGLGRIIWGGISDRTGRKAALALMLGLQGIVMLVFFWMGSSEYLLYLGATLIGFNFGGNFALFPAATADLFGAKNVGLNYGYVFTAYGVGGIVGPIMAGIIRDVFQNWQATFTICGVALLVATGIALTLRFRKN
ncbi:MAG: MFS transporter [Chloroflexi bacterium RBG_13_56_8]|nr:MAG: MFS transporter [Chloroflexi bacterium RBG_13_56_8]